MVGFFNRNQPQAGGLQGYAGVVESILSSAGVDVMSARMQTETGYGWTFVRGSATIEVYVSEQDGVGYFQALSPIIHLPANGLLPLYRRLLELNLQLTNAAIGIHEDKVYVFSERPLDGLDGNEANAIINLVSGYADDLDDKLIAEFGGRLYSRI